MKFNQVVALLNTTFPRIPSRHRKGNLQQYAFHIQMWTANFFELEICFSGSSLMESIRSLMIPIKTHFDSDREQLITQCRRGRRIPP